MKEIHVAFAEALTGQPREIQEAAIDREVETFSAFMANLGDWRSAGPLNSAERAMIKSYLVARLTGKLG